MNTTHTAPNPVDEATWLHWHTISGYIAMYAVRQSPYKNPDGLSDVLAEFNAAVRPRFDKNGMGHMNRSDVKSLLKECLYPIRQFQKWNERKNGNKSPIQFVSRYGGPGNPDDDFIDLDALAINVVNEMFRELDRDKQFDYEFDRRRMPKFKKKAVIIEAEQFTGTVRYENGKELPKGVCTCGKLLSGIPGGCQPHVHTHDNQRIDLVAGDWIVPDPHGKGFCPVKPGIFAANYAEELEKKCEIK